MSNESTPRRPFRSLIVALAPLLVTAWARASDPTSDHLPPPAQRLVDFRRDVEPFLARLCTGCHGAEKRKGGLRLDRKADALAGGDSGKAFEPGKSAESLLIEY